MIHRAPTQEAKSFNFPSPRLIESAVTRGSRATTVTTAPNAPVAVVTPSPRSDYCSGTPRKPAGTDLADPMVTVHVVSATVSHPPQPIKTARVAGAAVRVTLVPRS